VLTVFRELLQNSDDAQSSAVELHFETEDYLRRKSNKDVLKSEDNLQFPDLKATQVRPLSISLPFRAPSSVIIGCSVGLSE